MKTGLGEEESAIKIEKRETSEERCTRSAGNTSLSLASLCHTKIFFCCYYNLATFYTLLSISVSMYHSINVDNS